MTDKTTAAFDNIRIYPEGDELPDDKVGIENIDSKPPDLDNDPVEKKLIGELEPIINPCIHENKNFR